MTEEITAADGGRAAAVASHRADPVPAEAPPSDGGGAAPAPDRRRV